MNRRGFLQSAAMAVAALAVDPERLLWTPGKKAFFIPTATLTATVSEYSDFIVMSQLFDESAWCVGYRAGMTVDNIFRYESEWA